MSGMMDIIALVCQDDFHMSIPKCCGSYEVWDHSTSSCVHEEENLLSPWHLFQKNESEVSCQTAKYNTILLSHKCNPPQAMFHMRPHSIDMLQNCSHHEVDRLNQAEIELFASLLGSNLPSTVEDQFCVELGREENGNLEDMILMCRQLRLELEQGRGVFSLIFRGNFGSNIGGQFLL